MGIDPGHFLRHVIIPTLNHLGPAYDTNAAVQLCLGTALAETNLEYLHQIGGPGRGFYQIEPATHKDIWRFLGNKKKLAEKIREMKPVWPAGDDLLYEPRYSTAIARVRYLYTPEPLPTTVERAAKYWLKFYNAGGKGTVEHYIDAWNAAH